ncbi:hypothetical protein AV656_05955 [Bhargavaea cecembensis]|uniref:Alpha-ribazole-5-phosphate synthase n=1 Tax=Bhargavaea cecembensis TaxID=394098 RepID=A0A161RF11_9BACL|nr:hypothetical protein [Bhargavaea cecembensis]KZE38452.1 hypothetical protein AV656_05955 [Bhargavaea cecembensis]
MRNALELGGGWVVTTDNSGGIGKKAADAVHAPDELVGYFSARVTLLEQWAAGAEPTAVILHNFSGNTSWDKYSSGIRRAFTESSLTPPPISGSTETNMDMLQSAMSVTMIGRKSRNIGESDGKWFLYGRPLVGEAVIRETEKCAELGKVKAALNEGIINSVWPAGSGGIGAEWERLTGQVPARLPSEVDPVASAGPATAVFVRTVPGKEPDARAHFGEFFHEMG